LYGLESLDWLALWIQFGAKELSLKLLDLQFLGLKLQLKWVGSDRCRDGSYGVLLELLLLETVPALVGHHESVDRASILQHLLRDLDFARAVLGDAILDVIHRNRWSLLDGLLDWGESWGVGLMSVRVDANVRLSGDSADSEWVSEWVSGGGSLLRRLGSSKHFWKALLLSIVGTSIYPIETYLHYFFQFFSKAFRILKRIAWPIFFKSL